jgi:hypothetical protein
VVQGLEHADGHFPDIVIVFDNQDALAGTLGGPLGFND